MLGRKCRFHDLAFFDPVIFESLRQLVIDAENKVNNHMILLFHAPLLYTKRLRWCNSNRKWK